MKDSPRKSAGEKEVEKQKMDLEVNEPENHEHDDTPKVSREHDFTHTHPSHARHKTFGMDHEPGEAI